MKKTETKTTSSTKPVKKTATKKVVKKTLTKKVAKKAPVTTADVVKNEQVPAKSCSKCSSCQDEMTDAFIQEVTEEVKNDNLKAFWNKYGLYIVLFVVIAVSAAVGFETIKTWRQNQLQAKTEAYISAMIQDGNYENSIKALEKIAGGNYGIYSELARIQIADILFEQNKTEDALNMLQAIVDNEELNIRLRHLAALKLASYKIDTAPVAEVKVLIEPILAENSSWTPMAQEMMAMLAFKEGNFEKSKEIYNELLQNPNISEGFRVHIQDMISALDDM